MKYLAWSDIINLSWFFFFLFLFWLNFLVFMMKVFAFNSFSLGLKLRLSYGLGLCIIILTDKQWAFWLSSGSTLPYSRLSLVPFIYFLFFSRPSPLYCSRIIRYFLFLRPKDLKFEHHGAPSIAFKVSIIWVDCLI